MYNHQLKHRSSRGSDDELICNQVSQAYQECSGEGLVGLRLRCSGAKHCKEVAGCGREDRIVKSYGDISCHPLGDMLCWGPACVAISSASSVFLRICPDKGIHGYFTQLRTCNFTASMELKCPTLWTLKRHRVKTTLALMASPRAGQK